MQGESITHGGLAHVEGILLVHATHLARVHPDHRTRGELGCRDHSCSVIEEHISRGLFGPWISGRQRRERRGVSRGLATRGVSSLRVLVRLRMGRAEGRRLGCRAGSMVAHAFRCVRHSGRRCANRSRCWARRRDDVWLRFLFDLLRGAIRSKVGVPTESRWTSPSCRDATRQRARGSLRATRDRHALRQRRGRSPQGKRRSAAS